MAITSQEHTLNLFSVDRQEVCVDFDGGKVVSDAGLLEVRNFESQLGILADVAGRLPDPRCQSMVTHSVEQILTQEVYQILAGYPDGNDAALLRNDPLFKTICGISPDTDRSLAGTSTINRFAHAHTRREAQIPIEERPVLLEQRRAQTERISILGDYLPELFVRTRRQPPAYIIIDVDPTDDPTHGNQQLSGYHGYYRQHQYLPLLAFDGETGFPLAAVLRPGAIGAALGIVDVVRSVVDKLRQAWPDVLIILRGDTGMAVPELYEYCEREGLLYVFGYASNAVLQRRTDAAMADLQLYYTFYGRREPHVQRFERITDYEADGWSRPRTIGAKLEITPQGVNRRFIVTNLSGSIEGIYKRIYVQRGNVPEHPIEELKLGLCADRLASPRFLANSWKLLVHTLAYAIVVLYREAAADVVEVARAKVGTLRSLLWKVGAVVVTSARKIRFHFSSTWPFREIALRVHQSLQRFVEQLASVRMQPSAAPALF